MTADITSVLVVDDERSLADLYAAWLDDEYDTRTAYDGESALAAVDESVDVVLLDRRMPGLSGDEVLDRLPDRDGLQVVMATAVEPDFDIIDMGFDDYLVKPVSRTDLTETLESLEERLAYTDKVAEYATLVSKRTALEAEKTESALAASEEFADLTRRIEELRSDVDPVVREFDDEDVVAVLRDLQVGDA